jgi:hypothetical protein
MTVHELIEELKHHNPDDHVLLTFEGSDYECAKTERLPDPWDGVYAVSIVAGH